MSATVAAQRDAAGPNPKRGESIQDMARPADGAANFLKQRLQSLDAYRGLIMITLAFESFGLAATARKHLQTEPSSGFWQAVQHQFSHVEWAGCAYTDLIQPSFMFMVGVSMAYSYLKRRQMGHSYGRMLGHAVWRSLVLIFLGVFLMSNWDQTTNWTFVNVLTQIGLGYAFLFLLWGRTFRTQAITAAGVLVGTWLLFVLYPGSGVALATGAPDVGVTSAWAQEHLAGIHAPWHKNANVGHAIDLWFLNLFPRSQPFRFNEGGYPTLNFLPSLATMLFGLMCGELLRSGRSPKEKLTKLALAGLGGLVLGQVLHWTGICPAVKRIWTPGWAIFSTGWCCLILAGLYGLIDVLNCRRWAFPLVVVGLNSVAMYCLGMTLKPWIAQSLKTHLGQSLFSLCGEAYEPMVHATLVGLVLWLICWWMYRRRIFLRI